MSSDTDAMFEAVYLAPDEDAPRRALADHLVARSDPRGELIALQLAASARDEKRERALLKKHAPEWIRPLGGALVAKSIRWERGFPVSGELATRKPKERDLSFGVAAMATLRALELGKPNTGLPVELVRGVLIEPPLRNLRSLRGVWRELLPDLATAAIPFRLERIECLYWGGTPRPGEIDRLRAAFAAGSGLPHLRELAVTFQAIGNDPELYDWLAATPVGRRLRVLTMAVWPDHLVRWLPALTAWGDAIDLERLELGSPDAPTIALHRTNDGWNSVTGTVTAPAQAALVEGALAKLPPGAIREIAIDGWEPPPSP